MGSNNEQMKRMTDLLKSGASMIFEHCPDCKTPLFKIKDEVFCPKCNKRIIIVKEGEEDRVAGMLLLDETEKTILAKLHETNLLVSNEKEPAKLQELGNLLTIWLEALQIIRRIKEETS